MSILDLPKTLFIPSKIKFLSSSFSQLQVSNHSKEAIIGGIWRMSILEFKHGQCYANYITQSVNIYHNVLIAVSSGYCASCALSLNVIHIDQCFFIKLPSFLDRKLIKPLFTLLSALFDVYLAIVKTKIPIIFLPF